MTLERWTLCLIGLVLVGAAVIAFRPPAKPDEVVLDEDWMGIIHADSQFDLNPSASLLRSGEWWGKARDVYVLIAMGEGATGRAALRDPEGHVHFLRVKRVVLWPPPPDPGVFSILLSGAGVDCEWEARLPKPSESQPGTVLVTRGSGSLSVEPFVLYRSATHAPADACDGNERAVFDRLRNFLEKGTAERDRRPGRRIWRSDGPDYTPTESDRKLLDGRWTTVVGGRTLTIDLEDGLGHGILRGSDNSVRRFEISFVEYWAQRRLTFLVCPAGANHSFLWDAVLLGKDRIGIERVDMHDRLFPTPLDLTRE